MGSVAKSAGDHWFGGNAGGGNGRAQVAAGTASTQRKRVRKRRTQHTSHERDHRDPGEAALADTSGKHEAAE
jgi:hypothetical protein